MDFLLEYSTEQKRFAREVTAWIKQNVPEELLGARDPIKISAGQWQTRRELGRKLGEKGWLYPEYPREYGGGGLDAEHSFVLHTEIDEAGLGLPPYYTSSLAVPAILLYGTEEQKKRLLPPVLRDGAIVWQLFTEPEAGTDEANQQTNAIRDAREKDYFLVDGQKIFVGAVHFRPDYFWLLARSDLKAPRHQNLATFFAPADLPGITVSDLDLFTPSPLAEVCGSNPICAPGIKRQVFFDNVRIHESFLIGGERDGWKTTTATLDVEHGAGGRGGVVRNVLVETFLGQCKNNPKVVKRLRDNPGLLGNVVDVYIFAQIERLFSIRNISGKGGRHGGPQLQLHTKLNGAKAMADIAATIGPYAFTDDDRWSLDDIYEIGQRCGLCFAAGGTPEALKIITSRALGVGR